MQKVIIFSLEIILIGFFLNNYSTIHSVYANSEKNEVEQDIVFVDNKPSNDVDGDVYNASFPGIGMVFEDRRILNYKEKSILNGKMISIDNSHFFTTEKEFEVVNITNNTRKPYINKKNLGIKIGLNVSNDEILLFKGSGAILVDISSQVPLDDKSFFGSIFYKKSTNYPVLKYFISSDNIQHALIYVPFKEKILPAYFRLEYGLNGAGSEKLRNKENIYDTWLLNMTE